MKQKFNKEFQTEMMTDNLKNSPELYAEFLVENEDVQEKFREFCKEKGFVYLKKELEDLINISGVAAHSEYSAEYLSDMTTNFIKKEIEKPVAKELTNFSITKDNVSNCINMHWHPHEDYSFYFLGEEYNLIRLDNCNFQFRTLCGNKLELNQHCAIVKALREALYFVDVIVFNHREPKPVKCQAKPKFTSGFITRHNLDEFADVEYDSDETYSFYDYNSDLTYRLTEMGEHCFFCCQHGMPFSDMRHSTVYWALEEALHRVGFIEHLKPIKRSPAKAEELSLKNSDYEFQFGTYKFKLIKRHLNFRKKKYKFVSQELINQQINLNIFSEHDTIAECFAEAMKYVKSIKVIDK